MAWLYQPLLPAAADLLAGPVSPTIGYIKVWTGSIWVLKPVKYWSGTQWIQKPAKFWNGASWISA